MKKRNILLILLTIIGVVTFLDRINITVASDRIMKDLNLSVTQWSWVLSVFILSYGLFQIPLGIWGDKKGPRLVLSFVVLWWSLFTGFTGMVGGFTSLVMVRFFFGIGEAGAYPCMTGAISRWFPKSEGARAQGFIWGASRFGGALTPFVVIPVMIKFGWRTAFLMLGALGFVWVIVWSLWYKNSPAENKNITKEELEEIELGKPKPGKIKVPWNIILRNRQFWLILSMYWFYVWGAWFFFSWFPTFLTRGRGFTEKELAFAVATPFLMGVIGNIIGGYLSDKFSKKYGLKIGRRILGIGGLSVSAALMFLGAFIPGKIAVFIFLSLCFGVMDLMVPSAWAICIDVGRKYAGSISGSMNTAGNIGGFICALLFGYIVKATGNYNFPLYIIAGMLILGAILFSRIDASKPLVEEDVIHS